MSLCFLAQDQREHDKAVNLVDTFETIKFLRTAIMIISVNCSLLSDLGISAVADRDEMGT